MKKVTVSIILAIGLMWVSGCATAKSEESFGLADVELVAVQDATGEVEVPKNPQKIVVFDMGILDTLDALEEGKRVVGAVKESLPDYLKEYDTASIESVGTLKEPNLEVIHALEPDLIIISGRQRDFLEALQEIAPTLVLTIDYENYWMSFERNTKTMGSLVGKEELAAAELEKLENDIAGFRDEVQRTNKPTLTVLLNEGSLSVYGGGSRFGLIYDLFGFRSADETIVASTHGQSINYEYVLKKNPDYLFVVDRTTIVGGDTSRNDLMSNPLIQETKAYNSNQIVHLSPELWYLSGGGLESAERMLNELKQTVFEGSYNEK